jgi:hypothetical protein
MKEESKPPHPNPRMGRPGGEVGGVCQDKFGRRGGRQGGGESRVFQFEQLFARSYCTLWR